MSASEKLRLNLKIHKVTTYALLSMGTSPSIEIINSHKICPHLGLNPVTGRCRSDALATRPRFLWHYLYTSYTQSNFKPVNRRRVKCTRCPRCSSMSFSFINYYFAFLGSQTHLSVSFKSMNFYFRVLGPRTCSSVCDPRTCPSISFRSTNFLSGVLQIHSPSTSI